MEQSFFPSGKRVRSSERAKCRKITVFEYLPNDIQLIGEE